MVTFNPHAPLVLGNEFPPLVDAEYVPDFDSEIGYVIDLRRANPSQAEGQLVVKKLPPGLVLGLHPLVTLYKLDRELNVGSINSLRVAASAATAAGGTSIGGGGTALDAIADPSDGQRIIFGGGATPTLALRFSTVNAANSFLLGKRILDVSLVYTLSGLGASAINVKMQRGAEQWDYGNLTQGDATSAQLITTEAKHPFGEINPFWDQTLNPDSTFQRYPFTQSRLRKLDTVGSGGDIDILLTGSGIAGFSIDGLQYVGLDITYCEENRYAVAADIVGSTPGGNPWDLAGFLTDLADPQSLNAKIIEPDQYVFTLTLAHAGDMYDFGARPTFHALRYLDEPYTGHPPRLFTRATRGVQPVAQATDRIPQLVLWGHDTQRGASFGYGVPIAAPVTSSGVGGTNTVWQEIRNDANGAAVPYPQVRYYARKVGEDLPALRVERVLDLTVFADITEAEFDGLDEIVDGWKRIDLRFASPSIHSADGTDAQYRLRTVDEDTFGKGWEVLLARREDPPTTSSGFFNQATYGGSNSIAIWIGSSDSAADVAIMVSQDMPTVTGFGVSVETQPVTGHGLYCGLPPDCIPTGIGFNRLSWSALPGSLLNGVPVTGSPIVTGFGYFEVQRQDDEMSLDEWETVFLGGSPADLTFDDYEARVGVATRYRIRACNSMEFCGQWSATVTSTIPAPGITPGGVDTGVLILTTNQDPLANLAYTMSWEGRPIEEFVFPEADTLTLHRMFGRDYQVGFRPLERGGTAFSRTLLVNAAAVPLRTMDKGFTRLRDLAWDTVPYVCVRDELGNRWLSVINVPSGNIRRSPQIYLAAVDIVETTATPSPVRTASLNLSSEVTADMTISMFEDGTDLTALSGTSYAAGSPEVSGTFTAPPSGEVQFLCYGALASPIGSANSVFLGWELRVTDVAGAIVSGADDDRAVQMSGAVALATANINRSTVPYRISSLTPGQVYFIRTMHRVTGDTDAQILYRRLLVIPQPVGS